MLTISYKVKCAELDSSHQPPPATYTMGGRYLMYPMGDCIVLPIVPCWFTVSVCHALRMAQQEEPPPPKKWNHTAKLSALPFHVIINYY